MRRFYIGAWILFLVASRSIRSIFAEESQLGNEARVAIPLSNEEGETSREDDERRGPAEIPFDLSAFQPPRDDVAFWESIYGPMEDIPVFEELPEIEGESVFLDIGQLEEEDETIDTGVFEGGTKKVLVKRSAIHRLEEDPQRLPVKRSDTRIIRQRNGSKERVVRHEQGHSGGWNYQKIMKTSGHRSRPQTESSARRSHVSSSRHSHSSDKSEDPTSLLEAKKQKLIDSKRDAFGTHSGTFQSVIEAKGKLIDAKEHLLEVATSGGTKAEVNRAIHEKIEAKKDLIDSLIDTGVRKDSTTTTRHRIEGDPLRVKSHIIDDVIEAKRNLNDAIHEAIETKKDILGSFVASGIERVTGTSCDCEISNDAPKGDHRRVIVTERELSSTKSIESEPNSKGRTIEVSRTLHIPSSNVEQKIEIHAKGRIGSRLEATIGEGSNVLSTHDESKVKDLKNLLIGHEATKTRSDVDRKEPTNKISIVNSSNNEKRVEVNTKPIEGYSDATPISNPIVETKESSYRDNQGVDSVLLVSSIKTGISEPDRIDIESNADHENRGTNKVQVQHESPEINPVDEVHLVVSKDHDPSVTSKEQERYSKEDEHTLVDKPTLEFERVSLEIPEVIESILVDEENPREESTTRNFDAIVAGEIRVDHDSKDIDSLQKTTESSKEEVVASQKTTIHSDSTNDDEISYGTIAEIFSNYEAGGIALHTHGGFFGGLDGSDVSSEFNSSLIHLWNSNSSIIENIVAKYLRYGEDVVTKIHDRANWIKSRGFTTKIHTPGMLQDFNSFASANIVDINHESELVLFVTQLLQKYFHSRFKVTPSAFCDFLKKHPLRVTETKICQTRGQKRCPTSMKFRTIDGSCNNERNPSWGRSNTAYVRLLPARYADGIWEPPMSVTGTELPNARTLSVAFYSRRTLRDHKLTLATMVWGQFVSHDLARLTQNKFFEGGIRCCSDDGRVLPKKLQHHSCLPVTISRDDPFYSKFDRECMNFVRSITVPRDDCALGSAEQLNAVTSFLDLSTVYGSDEKTCDDLRAFGGGQLSMEYRRGRELLPTTRNKSIVCDIMSPSEVCYVAGDVRSNQHPQLTILHTLLARQHNSIVFELHLLNPHWDDERLFQEGRRINVARYQFITYNEWLPLILGNKYCREHGWTPSRGWKTNRYDPRIDPSTMNDFSIGAFRVLHTLIDGAIEMCPESRRVTHILRMSNHFLRPQVIERKSNLEDLLRGLTSQPSSKYGDWCDPEVGEYLFRSTNEYGLDLIVHDIQRGRDHGLQCYNEFRQICGLPRANNFTDLVGEIPIEKIKKLTRYYAHVDDIDLVVGAVLEKNLPGSILGPTASCIIGEQFHRSKCGDRYYYDNDRQPYPFTPEQIVEIEKSSLAGLLCDVTDDFEFVQPDAFELISYHNRLTSCEALPRIDLSPWREFDESYYDTTRCYK